jgi:hypothetical protein
MDVNKIFNLFDSGSEEDKKEENIIIDFQNHPAYWLGMFKKLILNNKLFKVKLLSLYEKIDPGVDVVGLEESGDKLAFERAWYYIDKFDINNDFHKESINLVFDEHLLKTLEDAIFHFQELELYERCSHIKKISDEIKKNFN